VTLVLSCTGSDDPEAFAIDEEAREEMHDWIDALYRREAMVIRWRYDDDLTWREIGVKIGASPQRARQILIAAENRLCRYLGQPPLHGKKP